MRVRRQHDEALARDAVRVEHREDAKQETLRDVRMAPVEQHERRVRVRREDLREERVVVGMDLEERLRAQQQRAVVRQPEARTVDALGDGRMPIAGADPRQPDQSLGVVRLCVRRLHVAACNERVDRRVAARHRMAPPRELPRCEAQRRERERRVVHPELGIDEHVERVVANDGRDHRRTRPAAAKLDEAVGARGDFARDRVLSREQVIDEHLEAVAVEVGDPAAEVASGGTLVEERRGEADAKLAAPRDVRLGREFPKRCVRTRRRVPLGRTLLDQARGECPVRRLQRAIVAALVGEEEVRPAQPVDHLRRRELRDEFVDAA